MRTDRAHCLFVFGLALCAGLVACAPVDRVDAPPSDHFDGERFFNPGRPESAGPLDLLAWKLVDGYEQWGFDEDGQPGPPPPERVGEGELRVTWVGHATLLVQMSGFNVLTDPVWSDTVGPLSGVGPRRKRAPGLRFEELPPIDAVVISHNHFDHLDMPTLHRLVEAHPQLTIFAGLGTAAYLEAEGLPASTDLDWWASATLADGLTLTAAPAVHWSVRGLTDRNLALWCSWVLDDGHGPVYFAGDTAWGDHFDEVRERMGPSRLALLPIGAYEPRWFMRRQHIDPAEAVEAALALEADVSIGMHFGTFDLADEGRHQPVEDLRRALRWYVEPPDFRTVEFGIGVEL